MLETPKQNPGLRARVRSTQSFLGSLLWTPGAQGRHRLDILMFKLVEGWLLKTKSFYFSCGMAEILADAFDCSLNSATNALILVPLFTCIMESNYQEPGLAR